MVNIESDNKDFFEVEFNNEVLASMDERERLGKQRADFPRVYCEMEFSQVLYEDKGSSRS